MVKANPDDIHTKRIFILLLSGFCISFIRFVILFFIDSFAWMAWIGLALSIVGPGCSIAAFIFMYKWGQFYEQQMGAGLPILSSRLRRIIIGEIFVFSGMIFNLFSLQLGSVGSYMGVFTIIGEIMVGTNLIRSGKILRLDAFPQSQVYTPGQPRVQTPVYQEYPKYVAPQKLIPDKAYFCPSCGAKLESESQDFCMKCGNPIPKPKD
jgi:hypothetical protein